MELVVAEPQLQAKKQKKKSVKSKKQKKSSASFTSTPSMADGSSSNRSRTDEKTVSNEDVAATSGNESNNNDNKDHDKAVATSIDIFDDNAMNINNTSSMVNEKGSSPADTLVLPQANDGDDTNDIDGDDVGEALDKAAACAKKIDNEQNGSLVNSHSNSNSSSSITNEESDHAQDDDRSATNVDDVTLSSNVFEELTSQLELAADAGIKSQETVPAYMLPYLSTRVSVREQ